MLTTLYLLLLKSIPSSYSVYPRSSWDAHHPLSAATPEFILSTSHIILGCSPLPTATPDYSKFILITSQDHPGILTTFYLLLLRSTTSSYSYIPGSSWDAHHLLPMYCYSKFITGQHTNSRGSVVTDPGIIPGLCCMSE